MTPRYSPEDREKTLTLICNNLQQDVRVTGCVLVGSGSIGFTDEFSDIDLAVATFNGKQVDEISEHWKTEMQVLFPVFCCSISVRGKDHLLLNFLLSNYLEINMGILPFPRLEARKPNWKIVFDRTNSLEKRMSETWQVNSSIDELPTYYEARISALWHYVLHAVTASKRGNYWQALSDIEEIRNQAIRLYGLLNGLVTKRNRDVDGIEERFLDRLEGTLVASMKREPINRAIKQAVVIFFEQAHAVERQLGLPESERLERKMEQLLDEL